MSESMTRGADVMLVQGTTVRHDRAGMAVTMPLPCGDAGPVPLAIDPERFAGLVSMGITHIECGRATLGVTTQTGLKASLPALADPHRTMTLGVAGDHQVIAPTLFTEWLDAGVALASAASSPVVCTYRSHVFVFTRKTLAATRLAAGWPMPSVIDAAHLRNVKRIIGQEPVDSAEATRALLLARAQGRVLRIEARDALLPQSPIEMLARTKAHQLPAIGEMASAALAAAVQQLWLTHQAFGTLRDDGGDPTVEVRPNARGLVLRTRLASIEVAGQMPGAPALPASLTSLAALKVLQACADFGEKTQLVAYPGVADAGSLIVRTGNTSMFAAAQAAKEGA